MNSPARSKFFKFKKWLTIKDTAVHLSNIFSEPVCEADVLQLGLDGHLILSVNFVNCTPARNGKVVPYREARRRHYRSLLDDEFRAEFFEKNMTDASVKSDKELSEYDAQQQLATLSKYIDMPLDDFFHRSDEGSIEGLYIGNGRVLEFEKDHVYQITGVWDLPMIGNEKIDIERRYQRMVSGIEVDGIYLDGTFVSGENDKICQLQESFGDRYGYRDAISAQFNKLRRLELSKSINRRKEKLLILRREKLEKLQEIEKEWNNFNKYFPAGGLPEGSVLVVRTEALRDFEQFIAENEAEKKISTKPHGNTEHNSKKREEVLGAALSVLSRWPEVCKNGAGRIEATKIRVLIENKGYMFWREDGEPPLSTGQIEKLLRQWLKKTD